MFDWFSLFNFQRRVKYPTIPEKGLKIGKILGSVGLLTRLNIFHILKSECKRTVKLLKKFKVLLKQIDDYQQQEQ